MDDATKLVSELQDKLAELDQKVWKYRQDMAAEFDRYLENLLRNVPSEISEAVSNTVAESLRNYESLCPTVLPWIESSSTSTSSPRLIPNGNDDSLGDETSASPSSRQPHGPEEPEVPRSPHARDLEFRGVFTPNYLPLLDNSHERRSSHDSTA